MNAHACIGEPISWLRLERHAAGAPAEPALAAHLAACPACRACLAELREDVVVLRPLVIPAPRAPARPWWRAWWTGPAMALAAAAVVLLVVVAPEGHREREDVVGIKGVGDVMIGVVRERDGVIREDLHAFRAGDRWKVVVTCPPAAAAAIAVTVTELGTTTVDRPLPPTTLACGNRVVVPGAFTLTGTTRTGCASRSRAPGTSRGRRPPRRTRHA